MNNDKNRWSIGKNDIDRDNRLISRDPSNSSYLPDDNRKTNFSKKNILKKCVSLILSVISFLIISFLGTNILSDYSKNPLYLGAALIIASIIYTSTDYLLSKFWEKKPS